MLGICMRYAQCKDEAEDILIEGFMNVYIRLESYRGESSLEYWIRRVIINTAISHYRRNAKHYYHLSIDEHPEYEVEDYSSLETSYSQKELLKIIQEMPEYLRVVLNLRAFEACGYDEIALQLGISEITSRTRFSKAKKWLEERLNPKSQRKLKVKK